MDGKLWLAAFAAATIGLAVGTPARGQEDVVMTYMPLGGGSQGVLYEPAAPGENAAIGVVTSHPYSSYMNHSSCSSLAQRGYRVLCADSPFTNAPLGYAGYEDHAPTIRAAIEALRGIEGVSSVVLLAHSMAAPEMAFYQNVAENGPEVCLDSARLLPCDDEDLADLPAADGIILMDPHLGDGFATLSYLDPAITDDSMPGLRDQSLDMFDPANGYDLETNGGTFSDAFRQAYFEGQAARNAMLIERAQDRLAAIEAGEEGAFPDDEAFIVPGGEAARLWQADLGLLNQSQRPHTLLHGDGTTTEALLVSVRRPSGKASDGVTFADGALPATLRSFLGAHTVRTTEDYGMTLDDLTGVEWASSNTSTMLHVEGITVPVLVMSMTGHYFMRPAEMLFDAAVSQDKDLVGVQGASHGVSPCRACETTEGEFGDTVAVTYDYIDDWMSARF